MKHLFSFLVVLLAISNGYAETVITTDGRAIRLEKDGTYQIIKLEPKDGYQNVDIVDLQLEPEAWLNKPIRLTNVTISNKAKSPFIYQHATMTGIVISGNGSKIPKITRRAMLKKCYAVCENATVIGIYRKQKHRYNLEVHDVTDYLAFIDLIR